MRRRDVEQLVDDERITAMGLLHEAHAALSFHLEREMEHEGGLSLTWYEVLLRLGRSPGGRLRMSDLAAAVALTSSGTTRLVDRIEAAGLIRREPCPEDRRVAYAVLTDEGWKVLGRTTPVHLSGLQRHLVDVLGDDELQAFGATLRRLRDANWRGPGTPVG